jgi:hypothetical protein
MRLWPLRQRAIIPQSKAVLVTLLRLTLRPKHPATMLLLLKVKAIRPKALLLMKLPLLTKPPLPPTKPLPMVRPLLLMAKPPLPLMKLPLLMVLNKSIQSLLVKHCTALPSNTASIGLNWQPTTA